MSSMGKASAFAGWRILRVLVVGTVVFGLGVVIFHNADASWFDKLKWFALEQEYKDGAQGY